MHCPIHPVPLQPALCEKSLRIVNEKGLGGFLDRVTRDKIIKEQEVRVLLRPCSLLPVAQALPTYLPPLSSRLYHIKPPRSPDVPMHTHSDAVCIQPSTSLSNFCSATRTPSLRRVTPSAPSTPRSTLPVGP